MRVAGRLTAGDLNERITLQARAAGIDVLGNATGAWTDSLTVWAKPEPIRGQEFFASGQMQAETQVRFVVRWRSDIDETMRVLWRGEPYEMTAPPIDTDGARERLELMCSKGIRDGR